MLAGPPPSCGRLPAPVPVIPRPSSCRAAPGFTSCLRAATRPTGRGARTRLPRRGRPTGRSAAALTAPAALPRSARHPSVPAPPRPPRSRHWSRMPPTIQAHGGPAPCLSTSEMLSEDDSLPGRRRGRRPSGRRRRATDGAGSSRRTCYLVDPASSHMLVSKIKPCMCKYELIRTVKLRMAH